MKTRKKNGFKNYIRKLEGKETQKKSLLRKGDVVFYFRDDQSKKYGLVEYNRGREFYCTWIARNRCKSYGWMPVDEVFIETSEGDVPIITLDWDKEIGEKPNESTQKIWF